MQANKVKASASSRINNLISVGPRDIPSFAFPMISFASSFMRREKSTRLATERE